MNYADTNYSEFTDETLVSLSLLGENNAFEALVIRYRKAVTASAYSATRNASLAEDVMQESFVSAWLKLNTLREPDKFGAWICRIAKNKAKNLAVRYGDYISFDMLENTEIEINENPADLLSSGKDDYNSLHAVIGGLSDKVKDVINLYYFESASIDEISTKLNLPAGTVKRRLHDGREKIRKEYGYMEKTSQTSKTSKTSEDIAKSVLEKIERVKAWYIRDSKDGFETDYNGALAEIEKMPDTEEKYYNMAEVMQLGFWWLPGDKNDELVEKIRKAAEKGKNNTVLGEIWKREADKYYGDEKREYIINTLIPKMENAGMTDAVGWEWFWLGDGYFGNTSLKRELGYEAFDKALAVLPKHNIYHATALGAIRYEKFVESLEDYKQGKFDMLKLAAAAKGEQYVLDNGRLYRYKQNDYYKGSGYGVGLEYPYVSVSASRCDGIFYDSNLKAGESVKSYDGTTELTFASDNAEIETPCGKFDGCQIWVTEKIGFKATVWYKRGVGIVYLEVDDAGRKARCALKRYNIAGGGLIPLCEGNVWEYDGGFDPENCDFEHAFEIISFNGSEAIAASHGLFYRKSYSPDKWEDMILQMRRGYHDGGSTLRDVSFPMERATILAKTPYQKAHTAAAADCMKRIMESNKTFTPDGNFDGYWNFFNSSTAYFKDGKITLPHNFIYSFEWKGMGDAGDAGEPLLGNDILGIIDDITGCIWCDKWQDGASVTMKSVDWMKSVTTVTAEHLDSIEVAAGRFDDCLKVSLDIKGEPGAGLTYRTGKKEYYYAKNIGIVKCVHHFKDGAVTANYELTSYEGTGGGYMPVKDGLVRIYEAIGLTKGFIAKAEYTFCDDGGVIKILQNRTGIRERKPYSPDSWDDMMTQMRKEYWTGKDGKQILKDVSFPMERAAALAKTKYQKAHTAAALDVMKRIFEGDKDCAPDGKFTGIWNFFQYHDVTFSDGKIISDGNDRTYAFDWKETDGVGDMGYYLAVNYFMTIISNATGCIWCDEWKAGTSMTMTGDNWYKMTADVTAEHLDCIEVAAGRFDDCLKVTFDIKSPNDQSWLGFLHGKKEYYYANGIGLIHGKRVSKQIMNKSN